MTSAEKILPQNIEAEVGVLGSILIDPGALACVADGVCLAADDFFREAHRTIYRAALTLYSQDIPVDFITIIDELRRSGKLEDVDGEAYVMSLPNNVPTSENALYYAKIVHRTAEARRTIEASAKAASLAYGEPDNENLRDRVNEIFAEVWAHSPTPPKDDDLFPILSDLEAEDTRPARGIVGNILFEGSLAILYGPSGRWKSFLALAWALCIATGKHWFDRPVRQGHVVYIAAEGGRGIGRRVTAWKRHHGISDASRFHLLPVPVNLLSPEHVDRLIRTIERAVAGVPVLIVVDTLSRSMVGGDENAGKDGSRAIAAADALRAAFDGVTVLMVAHPGKNEDAGIRGWSGYFQWADTVMHVNGVNKPRLDCGDVVTLSSEKPKDTEPFDDITFTAQKIQWADGHGETTSSLVLVAADKKYTPSPDGPGGRNRRIVWEVIREHQPITHGELLKLVVRPDTMGKTVFNEHLSALKRAGQVRQNAFGAYECPDEPCPGGQETDKADKADNLSGPVRPPYRGRTGGQVPDLENIAG